MLARDPADGLGQITESRPMHELGDRRYQGRRLQIALHDVPRPIIGCHGARRCGGGRDVSGGTGNQSATDLEEGAAGRLLPSDRLLPRPMNVSVRRGARRVLIAHRTPPYPGAGSLNIAVSRAREPAWRAEQPRQVGGGKHDPLVVV